MAPAEEIRALADVALKYAELLEEAGEAPNSMHCACLFERRDVPDWSGKPPKLLDECGYHSEQRKRLAALLEEREAEERLLRHGHKLWMSKGSGRIDYDWGGPNGIFENATRSEATRLALEAMK